MLPLRDNVPTRTFPVVTVALIAANAVVWFWELGGRGVDYHVVKDGFYPCTVEGPCDRVVLNGHAVPHTLGWLESTFTSMFMHGSWEHILGNMLFLWIFGNNVEDAIGRVGFLFWYLAAGVAAMASQTAVTLAFTGTSGASVPNIGASGANAGVLGAYFILYPRAKVLTWIFIIIREIPAFWFLLIWIGLQLWSGGLAITQPQAGGGVAFFAHIGGFAFGILTIRFVGRRPDDVPASRYPVY